MTPYQPFFDFFKPIILAAWAANSLPGTPTLAWAYPNAPEPAAPAFVLRAVVTSSTDHSQYSDVDAQGSQTVSDQVSATLTITGIGKGTTGVLDDVKTACRTQTNIRAASVLNIALVDRPRVQDVTGLISRIQYEERGQLSVTIRFVNSVSDNVGFIETVNIEGTYKGAIQDITEEITVVIPQPED